MASDASVYSHNPSQQAAAKGIASLLMALIKQRIPIEYEPILDYASVRGPIRTPLARQQPTILTPVRTSGILYAM